MSVIQHKSEGSMYVHKLITLFLCIIGIEIVRSQVVEARK